MTTRPSNVRIVLRAVARRCPNCGASGIFASYTELRQSCPTCGLRLQRGESDYFIGAYLLNLVAGIGQVALPIGNCRICSLPPSGIFYLPRRVGAEDMGAPY